MTEAKQARQVESYQGDLQMHENNLEGFRRRLEELEGNDAA